MSIGNGHHSLTDTPLGDIAYLTRSAHRLQVLQMLNKHPRTRSELCEVADVSSSTMRRTLHEFENRIWIQKDGNRYVVTELGDAVTTWMYEFVAQIETAGQLRPIWNILPQDIQSITLESWDDITITLAEPQAPYRPINRFELLLQESESIRYISPGIGLMEPCFSVLLDVLTSGVHVKIIDRPSCHRYFLETYPDQSEEFLSRQNFDVFEHDALPSYGIGLLDERIVISCYEQTNGTVRALLDTESPDVREWAESTYNRISTEAHRLDPAISAD